MKRLLTLLVILIAVPLAACQGTNVLEEPPEIIYGQDVCDECSMIISDPRFAAAYVTTDEQIRLFDDIGDMLAHDARQQENVHVYWVHDFNTEKWTRATEATFVINNELISPMGWGLAAFKTAADAEAYQAANGGRITTYADLQQSVAAGSIDPEMLHDHTQHMEDETAEHEMEHEMDHETMNHEEMNHDGN